jgi:hypothetical protein
VYKALRTCGSVVRTERERLLRAVLQQTVKRRELHESSPLDPSCLRIARGSPGGSHSTARRSGVGYCKECVTQ